MREIKEIIQKILTESKSEIKEIILDGVRDALKDDGTSLSTSTLSEQSEDPGYSYKSPEHFVEILKPSISEPLTPKIIEASPIDPSRFINLGNGLYYCKNIKATTFMNKADWGGKDTYPLPGSKTAKLSELRGTAGVALSMPLKSTRLCTLIRRDNGYARTFPQIDVGPGYVDDPWWIEGRAPKTESGIDYKGNKSALAGVDLTPIVWELMDLGSYDMAFEKGINGFFDLLIFDPVKPETHTDPDKPKTWREQLLPNGTEYFKWESNPGILSGWTTNTPPSGVQLLNLTKVLGLADKARKALGPIRIASGLRDAKYNTSIGGRSGSLHITGQALDLHPMDVSYKELYEWCVKNLKNDVKELYWEQHKSNPNREHVHIAVKINSNDTPDIRIIE